MTNRCTPDPRQGVFSTTLVVEGAPIALAAHVSRLAASVRVLYGAELPPAVSAHARERARGHALALLRLTAVPGEAGGVCTEAVAEPIERSTVLAGAAGAIDLCAAVLDDWPAAHKWADRSALHALHVRSRPAVPLLVARDGTVRETIRGNVFALGADGVLRTPPADGSILPGVARAQLIALAREAGLDVREQSLSLTDLLGAREAFATNSVRGVEPVRSLDDRLIPVDAGTTTVLSGSLAGCWFARQPG
jgi:para-aminobenzoate synthetase/4-amino-4-deoxychorismate lyase